jgi:hypothetical protein
MIHFLDEASLQLFGFRGQRLLNIHTRTHARTHTTVASKGVRGRACYRVSAQDDAEEKARRWWLCVCSLSGAPPLSLSSDLDNNRGMLCRSVVVSPSVSFPLLILIHFRVRASGLMPAKQVNLRGPVVGGSALVMLMHNEFCHVPLTLTLRARRRPVASACTDPPAHAQGACAVPAAVWMDANRLLVRLLISLPCFVTLLLTARRRWIPVRE